MMSLILSSALICSPFPIPVAGTYNFVFDGVEGDQSWTRVAKEIEQKPFATSAPGYETIGYGLTSDGTSIFVFTFNSVLEAASRDMRETLVIPEHLDELSIQLAWNGDLLTPSLADAVDWAYSEIRSRGANPNPSLVEGTPIQDWIAVQKGFGRQYDPQAVIDKLVEWDMPHLIPQVER